MDKIQSAIDITLSEYPWIGKAELVRLFMDYSETHLMDIIGRVELPSRVKLKSEWFLEKRKAKKYRMSEEELREREAFVEWLRKIKTEKRERAIDAVALPFETDGWGRDDVIMRLKYPFASPKIRNGVNIYSKDFEEGLPALGSQTLLGKLQRGEVDVSVGRRERLDEMIELISEIAREISQNRVEEISHYYDDDFGFIVEIIVNQTDKEAFGTWLRLIEELKPLGLESLVTVDWTGENVLSKDELVHKTVDVMLKLGIRPKLTERLDVKKELEEEWL